jgi:hypothetical protein
VKIDPIKNHLAQSIYGTGTLAGLEAPIKSKGIIGKVFLKHGSNPTDIIGANVDTHCVPRVSATPGFNDSLHSTLLTTAIDAVATTVEVDDSGVGHLDAVAGEYIRINDEIMLVTIVDNNELTVIRARAHTTATTHTDGDDVIKLVNEQSYIETTVRVKQNGNENVIEDVANENYQIAGATVDVINSNQFSRIKEIGNPFGNEIRVGLAYNGLSLSQVGSTTATSYEINTEKSGFYGAFSINFSILCVHEDSKTDKY